MFVAKFQQVTNSDVFTEDKNDNMPFIGDVLAGSSKGSIYNGSMFIREGLIPNKVYLCDNFVDEAYPKNVQTRIISEIPLLELQPLMTQLGSAKVVLAKNGEETPE